MICLDEQMNVVALDAEVDDPERAVAQVVKLAPGHSDGRLA